MESPERGRGMAQARSSPHSSHSLRERQEGDSMPTLDDIILGHRKKGQIETNRGGGQHSSGFRALCVFHHPTARHRHLSAIVLSFSNINPIRKPSLLGSKDAGAAAGTYLVFRRVC